MMGPKLFNYNHFNSLIRTRPSLTTTNLPWALFRMPLIISNLLSGYAVNILRRITPYVDLPSLKISSPKSLSFVITILYSRSARNKTSSSNAFGKRSLIKTTSYPARFNKLVNLLPRFASMRNFMRTLYHRKYILTFQKLLGVHKSGFDVVLSYFKILSYFLERLALSNPGNNLINSDPSASNHRLTYHHLLVDFYSFHEIHSNHFNYLQYSSYLNISQNHGTFVIPSTPLESVRLRK